MRAIRASKLFILWLIVALLAATVVISSSFDGDDLLGLLQGLLLFGLLGIALLLRWTIIFRFWSDLVAWLRRGFR